MSDRFESRRAFLRTTGGAALGVATVGTGGARENGAFEGETITVGPRGDLVYAPRTVWIDPGTTVRWRWDSDNHNVVPTNQPDGANWEGYPETANTGTEHEHTFEVEGTYEYVCEPHKTIGMRGKIVVGDVPDHVIVVGPNGNLAFEPAELTVAPGEMVGWRWESDNHNVVPTSTPEGAEWEGYSEVADYGAGYAHAFEVEGTYEYVCEPHAGAGMRGTVTVRAADSNGEAESTAGESDDPSGGNESTAGNGADDGPDSNEDDENGSGETVSDENGSDSNGSETADDDGAPGPGVAGALAGLGATAGLLARETESGD